MALLLLICFGLNYKIYFKSDLFFILCYGLVLAGFYFFQGKFLFFPGSSSFGDCPEMENRNAVASRFGKIRYYFQAKSKPDSQIIMFHGNAGTACDRTYFLDLLRALDSNVILFEYPGYGRDSDTPGEALILEQARDPDLKLKENDPDDLPVLVEIAGCGHNDILDLGANRIRTEIMNFVKEIRYIF